ncbi:bifunctional glutamate--cysteine ligase GshA/glutathione synthetase GshB [Enterococcus lemanii]|uniref:Glutathione biosynthesis bifunctional protein GshAB n=1 Tax=Enterococcus lemanii TaxID=1159752 RepID=A0ABV9MVJ9_9ENTE|nr:bifunctional glutamate--cysteine ligase GshA/glutathione synthetase GshB [Enterococcus lemanii]MBM7708575.1 glutamate--cysteine ligase [Enterococcus lemanii]
MEFKTLLAKQELQPYLLKARYGIEREGQRVTLTGELVDTPHPARLGNRQYHPYIQTDFAETQMELITPVAESIPELFQYLTGIHDVAYRSMDENEMLWPLSMPPALPEKEEDILIAKLDAFEDVLYRRYLAKTYGRRKQMVSGIHFNFEFSDELLQKMFSMQTEVLDYHQFKTEVYLKVTRNYLHYSWLVTYLFGATPLSEARYFEGCKRPKEPVRSIRNSSYGYKNHEDVKVSYCDMETYLADITRMVEEGKLSEEKEFYSAVRLRGGKRMADLAKDGIRYIELRNLDLHPFASCGISVEQVEFLHFFLLFLLWQEEGPILDEWVESGLQKNEQVALEHPLEKTKYAKEAHELFDEMLAFAKELELPLTKDLLPKLFQAVKKPEETLAAQLYLASQKTSQKDVAVQIALANHRKRWAKPYQLAGFEALELSTQILIFDAIQKGIGVEVLDPQDQFLQLTVGDHIEYVKNGNMTSKDNYIVPLLMENKTVTKKVLGKAGFRVPRGREFHRVEEALASYREFETQAFVVKPKSTNYGLGISIFKEGASLSDYQTALEIAFKEDDAVLVEEFLVGTEYRFFVVDGQTKAILLRVPANVKGDGVHTIEELVAQKNTDPLRGTHHLTPLEKIQLGEIEQLALKEQGYQVHSVPKKDEVVYLRENSNISSGGDSIDMTDAFGQDYKEIAESAVKALGAVVCGIDLIIPDYTQPADEPGAYGIIEANFNPAMMIHTYPYQGQGRRLTMTILELLFPEMFV